MKLKRDKYDKIVSDIVRYRDNWTCTRCLKAYIPPSQALHCAHFKSRSHGITRHVLTNCDALCYGCHQYFTSNPDQHLAWKVARVGQQHVDLLSYKARHPCKMNGAEKELLYEQLKIQLHKFKEAYRYGHTMFTRGT